MTTETFEVFQKESTFVPKATSQTKRQTMKAPYTEPINAST